MSAANGTNEISRLKRRVDNNFAFSKRWMAMMYTCKNCGVTADDSRSLCNPTDVVEDNLCGIAADKVCEDKELAMKYSCAACGKVSSDAELLCDPTTIN